MLFDDILLFIFEWLTPTGKSFGICPGKSRKMDAGKSPVYLQSNVE